MLVNKKRLKTADYPYDDCYDFYKELKTNLKAVADLEYFDTTYEYNSNKNTFVLKFTLKAEKFSNIRGFKINAKVVDYNSELEEVLIHTGEDYDFDLKSVTVGNNCVECIFKYSSRK